MTPQEQKLNEAIEQEFSSLRVEFRPKFGNQQHIDVAMKLKEIGVIEKNLEKQEIKLQTIEKNKKKLLNLKQHCISLIRRDKNN